MSTCNIEPCFIDGQRGRLFVLLRTPRDRKSGRCVLFVPPFAEEMNKTRKMFTDVAQGLAERGIGSLLPDLYGTGDSEGEFQDADWEVWKDDLCRATSWSEQQGWGVNALFCVRLGCILGAEAAPMLPSSIARTVFWQPVLDGERMMNQFLRLRVVASMMNDFHETASGLRRLLRSGQTLEVAGYELSLQLLAQVDSLRLDLAQTRSLGDVHWLELVHSDEAVMSIASQRAIDRLARDTSRVRALAIQGQPFWSATEIVRIRSLIQQTIEVLAPAT